MAAHKFTVTGSLAGPSAELQRSLQRASYMVSAGLRTNDQVAPGLLRLPTSSLGMGYNGGLNWDAAEGRKQYCEWILASGFQDVVEGISAFLDSAHREG